MNKIKEFEVWQEASGGWRVTNPDAGTIYNQYFIQPYLFGHDNDHLADWLKELKEKYKVDELKVCGPVRRGSGFSAFIKFGWNKEHYTDANRYKLALNKRVRQFNAKQ